MRNIIIAPMYKKILFIISCFFIGGCSQFINTPTYQNSSLTEQNGEILGPERDAIVGEVSETIFTTIDRSFKLEEPLTTGVIEKSGMDVQVPEGRYTIYAGSAGNVYIYDEKGVPLIQETVDSFFGVHSVTVDLTEKHRVFFDGGLEGATISYEEEQVPNVLIPGIWEVGVHIDPGQYTFSIGGVIGYVQVFEEGKEVRVFELLGGEVTKTTSDIELVAGQRLKLTGAASFQYEVKK